jgi:asparaginyl-tRNA synthetase
LNILAFYNIKIIFHFILTKHKQMTYTSVSVKDLVTSSKDLMLVGKQIALSGWLFTIRLHGATEEGSAFGFASLIDYSTVAHAQVVMNIEKCTTTESKESIKTALQKAKKGMMVSVKGTLVECPKGHNTEQQTELVAEFMDVYGQMDSLSYPIAKPRMPMETIRQHPHLRFRDKRVHAITLVRDSAAAAVHDFFRKQGYIWAHTPIITSNDCEGAGETFHIRCDDDDKILTNVIKKVLQKKDESKSDEEDDDPVKKTFFKTVVHLSVSGQLHGEAFAHGVSKIYTFGPTFRADPSETSRHLAEFWMIEPEVCFITFGELKALATDFVKYVVKAVIEERKPEIDFLTTEVKPDLYQTLTDIVSKDFVMLSYTDAIKTLKNAVESYAVRVVPDGASEQDIKKWSKKQYLIHEEPVWGMDLKSEHERYLTDIVFKAPVILYHYPMTLKPFYMKPSSTKYEEGDTVDAMDLLIPGIGELIGGSMREDDYDALAQVMDEEGIRDGLEWYLDLRKYGSCPHGGFGLGFERLIMLLTGVSNIRDVTSFPRFHHHCIA